MNDDNSSEDDNLINHYIAYIVTYYKMLNLSYFALDILALPYISVEYKYIFSYIKHFITDT